MLTQQRIFKDHLKSISKAVKARCSDAQRTKALGSPTALGRDLLACVASKNARELRAMQNRCLAQVFFVNKRNLRFVSSNGSSLGMREDGKSMAIILWQARMDTWRMNSKKHLPMLTMRGFVKVHTCLSLKDLCSQRLAKDTLLNLFNCRNVGSCCVAIKILNSHAWLGLVWHAKWSGLPPPCKTAPAIKHLPSSFQLPCHPTPLKRNGVL